MRTMRTNEMGLCIAIAIVIGTATGLTQSAPLRIVVLEGEGAVNIIQQKTAVAPVVEVRDRNDLPVAGAVVTFSLRGGAKSAAFAGVGQSATVTTDAAGRATVSSLTPVTRGPVRIDVTAQFQGQTATTVINQTNVPTAADAAQLSAAATNATAAGAAATGAAVSAVQVLSGVGAAVAGAALLSRVEPAIAEERLTARVAVYAVINPVPFSGVVLGGRCGSRTDTWSFPLRLEEFGGVAVTFTRVIAEADGVEIGNASITPVEVPAKGTATRMEGLCAPALSSHSMQITYLGADAQGNEVSVMSPLLTMLPRIASAIFSDPATATALPSLIPW